MPTQTTSRVETTHAPRASFGEWLTRPRTRVLVLLTALLGTGLFAYSQLSRPGVYWSDVHVRFVAPANPTERNALQVSERSLIMTAGAVGQMVDDRDGARASSPDIHISGLGVRSGWSVSLPNRGGQYVNYFTDPYLDLQVVGSSKAEVRQTMQKLVVRVKAALGELQDRTKAPTDRISAKELPAGAAPVYYEHGSRKRAVAATLIIMIGVGAATASVLSRMARRQRRSAMALAA